MTQFPWADDPILTGGGECGEIMRNLDWTQNPLGPPQAWPTELRTLVSVMLPALQPMFICWGPQQIMLYNDPYGPICGARHPAGFGSRFEDLWHDIWVHVEPIVTKAYNGIGTQMDDIEFTMFRNGHAEETHFSFSYTPVRDSANVVQGFFCACNETTHAVLARRRQQSEMERLRALFTQAPGAIAVLEGPQFRFTVANDAYLRLINRRDIIGKTLREVLNPDEIRDYLELLDTVYRTGEAFVGTGVPLRLDADRPQAAAPPYLDFIYQPTRDDAGKVTGIFVLAQDVTDRVLAQQHQENRNRELIHRLKNQLAMLQAIVSQTMRNAPDKETALESISQRLAALARAHDLLIHGAAGDASLHRLVEAVRAVHDDVSEPRFVIDGPDLHIASRPALSLSLILHELATNAAKYGALAQPGGTVAVSWGLADRGGTRQFWLTWRESGGPPVTRPARHGTGSRLIRAGLDGASASTVTLDFAPGGLACRIAADPAGVIAAA